MVFMGKIHMNMNGDVSDMQQIFGVLFVNLPFARIRYFHAVYGLNGLPDGNGTIANVMRIFCQQLRHFVITDPRQFRPFTGADGLFQGRQGTGEHLT